MHPGLILSQVPFDCDGRVYAVKFQTGELFEMAVNSSNNSVRINPLFNTGVTLDPLALRPTDNLIYGLDPVSRALYRIDAVGQVDFLTTVDLPTDFDYLAGGVSNDGLDFYVVGSLNGNDQGLYSINLDNYSVTQIFALGGQSQIRDIALDPFDDVVYALDIAQNGVARIDIANASIDGVIALLGSDRLQGIYFDAFGDLFGYGTTAGGVASGLFRIEKSGGEYKRIANGPVDDIVDFASCPFTVAIQNEADPLTTLPCGEITLTFTVANPSDQNFSGIDFDCQLPPGVSFAGVDQGPAVGNLQSSNGDNRIRFTNMIIGRGISDFSVKIYVDDVAAGFYKLQAELSGFPEAFGSIKMSDNPITAASPDSTRFQVNRIEADEVEFSLLLCLGESVTLDASEFGGNINWNGGGFGSFLTVQQPGTYGFSADSGCVDLDVTYEVVGASCPYVIELNHLTEPQETFPCSEVVYQYIMENDSGLEREDITIKDSIYPEFQFIELITELETGDLKTDLPDNKFVIEGHLLEVGFDTIEFLVYVGDVDPGTYKNRCEMRGFHPELGVVRVSDDPRTPLLDSTIMEVKGTRSDTTFVDLLICNNVDLEIDASPYGDNVLWPDGSTDSIYIVSEPGMVELLVFDGCEDAHVFFNVEPADGISITNVDRNFEVHLGDSILLTATIFNEGQLLEYAWFDPRDTTLRCPTCLETYVRPFDDTDYVFYANNENCQDSAIFSVKVDKTRRVYFPNIFSASATDINNTLFFQSPDYGIIQSVSIIDRWGGLRYYSEDMVMNDPSTGWRPYEDGSALSSGVYIYAVEIEFIDGLIETFTGTITLVD